jgi:transposase
VINDVVNKYYNFDLFLILTTKRNQVHQFLAQRGVPVLEHPPYSPDLAPADFFLFPRLKSIMKGARFADVAAIQEV